MEDERFWTEWYQIFLEFIVLFFMNVILICYSCYQMFELRKVFERLPNFI
jgi:hypothetical protein